MDRISAFISYSSKEKTIGGRFKTCLERYCGFHTFIAHDDVPPSTIFEEEIIKAIDKSDIFIPLISQAFKKSDFTDQETGIAIKLNKKIIPIKLEDLNPYGFISKYQAMQYKIFKSAYNSRDNGKELVLAIAQIGLSHNQLQNRTLDSLVYAFCNSHSFDSTNTIIEVLSLYDHFTPIQLEKISKAIKQNDQIQSAWGLTKFKKFLQNNYDISID